MKFNKIFIKHVEHILELSKEFDDLYKIYIDENTHSINTIYDLTQKYVLIRATHGKILLMYEQFLMNNTIEMNLSSKLEKIDENNEEQTIATGKLYDISTFKSITTDINLLINNIDRQYKNISSQFPEHIGQRQYCVVFFVDYDEYNVRNSNDKYTKIKNIIDKCRKEKPQHIYKIIFTQIDSKGFVSFPNGTNGLNKNIVHNLNIRKLPALFIFDSSMTTEIPIHSSNITDEIFTSILDIIQNL